MRMDGSMSQPSLDLLAENPQSDTKSHIGEAGFNIADAILAPAWWPWRYDLSERLVVKAVPQEPSLSSNQTATAPVIVSQYIVYYHS
jgi:hypothetical protein